MTTVLYLDHTAKLGGGEIALLDLVSALDKKRYEPIVILASDGPLVERLQRAGVETHVIPLDPSIVNTRKDTLSGGSLLRIRQGGKLARYAMTLARWMRRRRVDIIHTNSLKSDLYGGIAARMAGLPVVWHVRDNIDSQYLPSVAASAFRGLARVIPNEVVANSESTLRCLAPRRGRGAVVYSGVAPRSLQPASAASPAEVRGKQQDDHAHGPTIAIIGRIAEWKGQHIFLQAAAEIHRKYPFARFWVIGAPLFGEHDYQQKLTAMVDGLGLEKSVEFLGFRNDIPELMERIDIVVHASILGEPFGQVVVQGMAAGKPVIATDGGALPEIVIPGETGILVPMGDASAMADAVMTLIDEPERAREMGLAGRRRVEEMFTITHTVASIEAVYEGMLRRRPSASVGSTQVAS